MPDYTKHWELADKVLQAPCTYPQERFKGCGIVTCAGGRYFVPCYVMLRLLRHVGCTLPVQIWHLGPEEITESMVEAVQGLDVEFVDALQVAKEYPVHNLKGWPLKPYSIIHSRFERVLFLDSDNTTVRNPEYLLHDARWQKTGAMFWPDYSRLGPEREIWHICRVEYRDEPEFESGQIVIDKRRCWKPLQVTMHLNERHQFYYRHIWGDKDTFHMAWHMCRQPYTLVPHRIRKLRLQDAMQGVAMAQHDLDGRRIFQHRNLMKWNLYGNNPPVDDFKHEALCRHFLDDLRRIWKVPENTVSLQMRELQAVNKFAARSPEAQSVVRALMSQRFFTYHRLGYDKRTLELCEDFTIGQGAGALEQGWYLEERVGRLSLCLYGRAGVICRLIERARGVWVGQWEKYERMGVHLTPSNKRD